MKSKNQENAIHYLDKLLTHLNNSPDPNDRKKVALISYWMKDYCNYLKYEKGFNPKKLKRYERGDVIKINLGYNVGSEEGGLHYAIVLDKDNKVSSPVITVIPLTSMKCKESEVYRNDVLLGNELYEKISFKFDEVFGKTSIAGVKLREEIQACEEKIINLKNMLKYEKDENRVVSLENDLQKYLSIIEKDKQEVEILQNEVDLLLKIHREISRMKKGSIALIEQITTISKMRIYDPKNIYNVLHGIKISSSSLDKIDEKLKELYIYK